jgi:uncharacterized membrane-anchored protein YhcB (DUF1043 family)
MELKDKFTSALENAKEKIDEVVVSTKDKLPQNFDNAKEKATDTLSNVAGKASVIFDDVKSKATVVGEDIKGKINSNEKLSVVSSNINELKNNIENREKKPSLDDLLISAIEEYNLIYSDINNSGVCLYTERERSVDLILNIEKLINSIANRPKSFDTDISEIKTHREKFQNICDFAKDELETAKKSAVGIGSGIAAGTAVASLAPSAALWVATTFGTASTGTAISTLSGAAATKAALAWLGGGAIAANGGGIAAGNALLALAGPVGWTIAGASVLTSVVIFSSKKAKTNKQKKEEIEKVKTNTKSLKESAFKIKSIYDETANLRKNLHNQYSENISAYDKDFVDLSEDQQYSLITLVNNTKSLATTLSQNI